MGWFEDTADALARMHAALARSKGAAMTPTEVNRKKRVARPTDDAPLHPCDVCQGIGVPLAIFAIDEGGKALRLILCRRCLEYGISLSLKLEWRGGE